jgi:hypothetical protein
MVPVAALNYRLVDVACRDMAAKKDLKRFTVFHP